MLWNYCQIWTVYFAIAIAIEYSNTQQSNISVVYLFNTSQVYRFLLPVECKYMPYSRILHALATRLYAQTFQLNRNYQTVVNHIYKYVPLFIRFNLPQISTALFLTIISTQSQPNTFQKCRFPNWICADLSSSSIPTKNDHFGDNA